ncbi:MAG: YbaB/EbfC family nucleoid-associated protein [Cytophagales bacterium]|nr:MAG: YbaB/EbfC family nucleoid-associated protein [Cytophagales bacterium]
MFDMMNMLGKVKEVQGKMKSIKENLVYLQASGESGAGLVKATVNGNRQVLKIEIDNSLLKPEDKDMIQDLTVAAINIALKEIEIKINEEMKKQTQGLLPNIPGMDLSNLFS